MPSRLEQAQRIIDNAKKKPYGDTELSLEILADSSLFLEMLSKPEIWNALILKDEYVMRSRFDLELVRGERDDDPASQSSKLAEKVVIRVHRHPECNLELIAVVDLSPPQWLHAASGEKGVWIGAALRSKYEWLGYSVAPPGGREDDAVLMRVIETAVDLAKSHGSRIGQMYNVLENYIGREAGA